MWDTLESLVKSIGPTAVVIVAFAVIYFNPSDQSNFQRNTIAQLESAQTQLKDLRGEITLLSGENMNLRFKVADLQQKLITLQSSEDSWPYPAWLKDASGKILFANKAYADAFLTPRGYTLSDYVGHDDYAVWPRHMANEFRMNDAIVMRTRQHVVVKEKVLVGEENEETMLFVKYPRFLGGVVVGVAGRYIPQEVRE